MVWIGCGISYWSKPYLPIECLEKWLPLSACWSKYITTYMFKERSNLNGLNSNLVLHLHKMIGLIRDRLKKIKYNRGQNLCSIRGNSQNAGCHNFHNATRCLVYTHIIKVSNTGFLINVCWKKVSSPNLYNPDDIIRVISSHFVELTLEPHKIVYNCFHSLSRNLCDGWI